MFDYRNESDINHIIEVITPILKELRKNPDIDGLPPISSYEPEYLSVYKKTREIYYRRIMEDIGFDEDEYKPEIACDNGVLYCKDGECLVNIEDAYYDLFSSEDKFIIPRGQLFWKDSWGFYGYYNDIDDLIDNTFPEEIKEYMGISGLSDMDFEIFKKMFPSSYEALKTLWKEPYAEEMTKEFYDKLQFIIEDGAGDDMSISYLVQVNVAIVPFLKKLRTDKALRRDKTSRFAVSLIRSMKWVQHYFPSCMGDICYGFTDRLFYNTQSLGSGGSYYGQELYPQCLSLSAEIAMDLIDYILAYLDTKYGFLPPEVRQMYRHSKETAN